jgi:cold shock CspA family protein
MSREKKPDDLARETAAPPPEPLGTRRVATGTVKWWRAAKGHGVFATSATAPWDIWCHFSAVDGAAGFVMLEPGERVSVEYIRLDQESFKYVAERVRRIDHLVASEPDSDA